MKRAELQFRLEPSKRSLKQRKQKAFSIIDAEKNLGLFVDGVVVGVRVVDGGDVAGIRHGCSGGATRHEIC